MILYRPRSPFLLWYALAILMAVSFASEPPGDLPGSLQISGRYLRELLTQPHHGLSRGAPRSKAEGFHLVPHRLADLRPAIAHVYAQIAAIDIQPLVAVGVVDI